MIERFSRQWTSKAKGHWQTNSMILWWFILRKTLWPSIYQPSSQRSQDLADILGGESCKTKWVTITITMLFFFGLFGHWRSEFCKVVMFSSPLAAPAICALCTSSNTSSNGFAAFARARCSMALDSLSMRHLKFPWLRSMRSLWSVFQAEALSMSLCQGTEFGCLLRQLIFLGGRLNWPKEFCVWPLQPTGGNSNPCQEAAARKDSRRSLSLAIALLPPQLCCFQSKRCHVDSKNSEEQAADSSVNLFCFLFQDLTLLSDILKLGRGNIASHSISQVENICSTHAAVTQSKHFFQKLRPFECHEMHISQTCLCFSLNPAPLRFKSSSLSAQGVCLGVFRAEEQQERQTPRLTKPPENDVPSCNWTKGILLKNVLSAIINMFLYPWQSNPKENGALPRYLCFECLSLGAKILKFVPCQLRRSDWWERNLDVSMSIVYMLYLQYFSLHIHYVIHWQSKGRCPNLVPSFPNPEISHLELSPCWHLCPCSSQAVAGLLVLPAWSSVSIIGCTFSFVRLSRIGRDQQANTNVASACFFSCSRSFAKATCWLSACWFRLFSQVEATPICPAFSLLTESIRSWLSCLPDLKQKLPASVACLTLFEYLSDWDFHRLSSSAASINCCCLAASAWGTPSPF